MGCSNSSESKSSSKDPPLMNKVIIKKETVYIIQNSWKIFSDVNSLAEHGINMVIRYS